MRAWEQSARFSEALQSLIALMRRGVSEAHCNVRVHKQGVSQARFDQVAPRGLRLITSQVVAAHCVPSNGRLWGYLCELMRSLVQLRHASRIGQCSKVQQQGIGVKSVHFKNCAGLADLQQCVGQDNA
jgi:hypothetical protein